MKKKNLLWSMLTMIVVGVLSVSLMSCLVACTKEEIASESQQVGENNLEIYQKTFDDAFQYLGGNSTVNLDDAIDYLKKMDGVTNVQVNDNIIKVTTQGNLLFSIDYNSYPDYELGSVDFNALQEYEKSVDDKIGGVPSNYELTSEVFKDYISKNLSYEENTTTTTKSLVKATTAKLARHNINSVTGTSTNSAVVKLKRKNFVIWSPYIRSDFQKEKEDVMKVVKSKTTQCAYTAKFSPKSFTELGAFDVVYLSSHGSKDGSFFLPKSCLSSTDITEYEKEISKKDSGVERAIRKIGNEKVEGYSLKENFFNKYLPDLSHTVIYTSACYFGADNCMFKKCCEAKGVADYFGSDNACVGADILSAFAEFYPKLMNGASTKMAFKNGKSYFTGSLLKGMTLETFKFKRFGKKTVSYVIPHATGIGNRTNYNNARAETTSSNSSAIVVNAQIRYSTEESDDILKSIECGICLQDMDTKQVTLIPFNSNNIISNEKKSYDDIAVCNISASLDNLTEGHQYAYCCYTKVDEEVTLSDETYKLTTKNVLSFKIHLLSRIEEKYSDVWYAGDDRGKTIITEEEKALFVKVEIKEGTYRFLFEKYPNLADNFHFPSFDEIIEENITLTYNNGSDYGPYEWECSSDYIKYHHMIHHRTGHDEISFEISSITSNPILKFSHYRTGTTSISNFYISEELINYELINE